MEYCPVFARPQDVKLKVRLFIPLTIHTVLGSGAISIRISGNIDIAKRKIGIVFPSIKILYY